MKGRNFLSIELKSFEYEIVLMISKYLKQAIENIKRSIVITDDEINNFILNVQRSLLSGDVDVDLVFDLTNNIRKKLKNIPKGVSKQDYIIKLLFDELVNILGRKSKILVKPKHVLLVGLFGSGKTTTAAKLGYFYKKHGLSVALVCCDFVRPASREQLQQLAEKIGAKFVNGSLRDVIKDVKKLKEDVVIIDTAGRDSLDKNMIEEVKKLKNIFKPEEVILILPADIGQVAKEQSETFNKALDITHVIVTKMDATAKGGATLIACKSANANVMFICNGEKVENIEVFDPEKFVSHLLGMPDLETLLQKLEVSIDEKKVEKIVEGDFTIEDFVEQLNAVKNTSRFSEILETAGLQIKTPELINMQEKKVEKWKHIINSMTKEERLNPEIIKGTRITRIAKGSGTNEENVRELVNTYKKVKKMMKKFRPEKLKRSGIMSFIKSFLK